MVFTTVAKTTTASIFAEHANPIILELITIVTVISAEKQGYNIYYFLSILNRT